MKIEFKKSKEFNFFTSYVGVDKYSFAYHSSLDMNFNYVFEFMNKNFKSIKWTETKPHPTSLSSYSFSFTDPADEAYFLLWSNDDIVER
jgi:hypothetical protein